MKYVVDVIVILIVCILLSIVDKTKDMFYLFSCAIWTINYAFSTSLLYTGSEEWP